MDTCCGITTISLFTDVWLSPTNKHMAEIRKKKISLFLSVHTHRHTRRNRHTLETPFCLAVVFVGLRPNPPPPSHCWINRRGVGGWGHSARATLGQNKKKPQHKLTLGRGWRGSIFLKTDYLRSPLCSLSLSLPPPRHKLFPWQLFRQCRSPNAGGRLESIHACMRPHCGDGWVTNSGTLHMQISMETCQAFSHSDPGTLRPSMMSTRQKTLLFFRGSVLRHVFPGVCSPSELRSLH